MDKYLLTIGIAYIITAFIGYWLEYLNISHLKKYGTIIPPEFEGQIDQILLKKVRNYTVENSRFGIISSLFSNVLLLLFLFGGIFDLYNSWIDSLNLSLVLSGLIFFLFLSYAETIISVPFSLYRTFKIENKYGFNTMTLKLWLTDALKSLAISTVLMSILIAGGLVLIQKSPDFWWFWVWCFFFIFSIFMMYIAPYVIEPLFNKFTLLDNASLVDRIRTMMQKVGIRISRVFRMDASKRTKHTNAYFTGIGHTKRIVLFDTLLEQLDNNEILSVLAHEAGHWKKKHILKLIIVTEIMALIVLYGSFHLMEGDILINLFHLQTSTLYAKVVVLAFIGSIILFPLSPLFHYFSRKHEKEADRFSCSLTGDANSMITSLVKLSKDNLSNLHPHPLYAAFHYSHPPVKERIKYIKELS